MAVTGVSSRGPNPLAGVYARSPSAIRETRYGTSKAIGFRGEGAVGQEPPPKPDAPKEPGPDTTTTPPAPKPPGPDLPIISTILAPGLTLGDAITNPPTDDGDPGADIGDADLWTPGEDAGTGLVVDDKDKFITRDEISGWSKGLVPGFGVTDPGQGFVPSDTDAESFYPTSKNFGGTGERPVTIAPGFDKTDIGGGLEVSPQQVEAAIPTPGNFGTNTVPTNVIRPGFDDPTTLGSGLTAGPQHISDFASGADITTTGPETAPGLGAGDTGPGLRLDGGGLGLKNDTTNAGGLTFGDATATSTAPIDNLADAFGSDINMDDLATADSLGLTVPLGAVAALVNNDPVGAAKNIAVATIMKQSGASAAINAALVETIGAQAAAMVPYVGWAIAAYSIINSILNQDNRKPSEAVILTDPNTNQPFFDARNFGGASNVGDNSAVLAPQINAINTWMGTLPEDMKASLREVQHEVISGPDTTLDQAWNALLGKLAEEAVATLGYPQETVNAVLQSAPRITVQQEQSATDQGTTQGTVQPQASGPSDQDIQAAWQQSGGTPQQLIEQGIASGATLADAERALGVSHQQASDYVRAAGYDPNDCFITEAVTSAAGVGDNAEELQVLRQFRDTVMSATPQGQALVQEYYAIAPMVVEAIAQRPDGLQIFQQIKGEFIDPAVEAAKAGDNQRALQTYAQMIAYVTQFLGEPGGEGIDADIEGFGETAQAVASSPEFTGTVTDTQASVMHGPGNMMTGGGSASPGAPMQGMPSPMHGFAPGPAVGPAANPGMPGAMPMATRRPMQKRPPLGQVFAGR